MEYFELSEFESPDQKGSGNKMQPSTLIMIDDARGFANIPFVITSGYRTVKHNAKVGGSNTSSHLKGCAVDIACSNGGTRWLIVSSLIEAGFKRIGIAKTFIHADNDPDKLNAIWTY